MDLGLKGKRALVLGASRGLGHAIAAELAAEGARLIVASRDEATIGQAAKAIAAAHGADVVPAVCDTASGAAIDALADTALARFGTVDILVNNTGGPPSGPVSAVATADWQANFERMVLNIIRLSSRLLPGMRAQQWGRILTVASSGVKQPIPELGISNTLRAALLNWSKTLSLEVAREGVTVNMVLPGRIRTRRLEEISAANAARTGRSVEDVVAAGQSTIPMGRYGTAEEFAAMTAFLASTRAAYITGSAIAIDGGLIAGT
ncbi:MAG: SDR family oxidoreductase [Alphaproteobacteria bacterium]